jgi:heme-degrading monooxygenase HmoA
VPRFESQQALEAWRDHAEHVAVQERGREVFFEDYWMDVCSTIRSYEFHRQAR